MKRDPSTKLRTGPLRRGSGRVSTKPVVNPVEPLRTGRRASKQDRARSIEPEAERPLDAEDVALASLEAKVRAEEARADLGSVEPLAGGGVRLPRAVISRLRAEAAKRHITPSELIRLALLRYLSPEKAGRRR